MLRGKRKFILIGALVPAIALVGVLVFLFSGIGSPDFISLAQLREQGDTAGQHVNVKGTVVPGSTSWDAASRTFTFKIADGSESVMVKYNNVAPGDFEPGKSIMVVGTYANGVIEARALGSKKTALCAACHAE